MFFYTATRRLLLVLVSVSFAACSLSFSEAYAQNDGQDLLVAAAKGDKEAIVELVKGGVDVDFQSSKSETALMHAAARGHADAVAALIDSGANVDLGDSGGINPMFMAAQGGYAEIAEQLLLAGATVDPKHKSGVTPLYLAAQEGHADVVKLLLSKGAEANVRGVAGFTPLIMASGNGHVEVVKLLLAHGAKNMMATRGPTALSRAVAEGRQDVVDLLAGAQPDMTDDPSSKQGVRVAQELLNELGCDAGTADGLIGRQTRTEIKDFEEWVGVTPTGKVSMQLLMLLHDTSNAILPPAYSEPRTKPGDTFNICVAESEQVCAQAFRSFDEHAGCTLDLGRAQAALCMGALACGKATLLPYSISLVEGTQSARCTPALWKLTCG